MRPGNCADKWHQRGLSLFTAPITAEDIQEKIGDPMAEDGESYSQQFKNAIEVTLTKAGVGEELIPAARRATYASARKLAPSVVLLTQQDYEAIASLVVSYISLLGLEGEVQVDMIPSVIRLTRTKVLGFSR